MKKRKQPEKLNALQRAQLVECINAGFTVKVNPRAYGPNKGFNDTPLFKKEEPKLF